MQARWAHKVQSCSTDAALIHITADLQSLVPLFSPSVQSSATALPQPVPWVWLQQHSQKLCWGQEQNWTFKVLQRFVHYLIAYICGFSLLLFASPPGKHYPWQSQHSGFCLEQSFKALEPMGAVWGCHSLQRLLLGFQTPQSPWSCPKSSTGGCAEEELQLLTKGTPDPWAPLLLHKTMWESPKTQPLYKRLKNCWCKRGNKQHWTSYSFASLTMKH